jgi:hypothetical protein
MQGCRRRYWLAWAAAFAALAAGCNDNALGTVRRRPNLPPATTLASGPPDSTYGVNYRVRLYWSGADPDGSIDHFDFILVDHPAIEDSIATTAANDPRRVVVTMPAADDPRWKSTTANDTLIVSAADTLRADPAPPPGGDIGDHDRFIRARSFERWHTFFVRAVDDRGAADPTPDYRTFNARTLAPTVALSAPVRRARSSSAARRPISIGRGKTRSTR